MIKTEQELIKYLKENWKKHFRYHLIGFNVPIFGWISKRRIGLVDIVFSKGKQRYFVEVKFNNQNSTILFWEALKVIGYVANERLNWNRGIQPVVMLHKRTLTIDLLVILQKLKIGYILLENKNEKIEFNVNLT